MLIGYSLHVVSLLQSRAFSLNLQASKPSKGYSMLVNVYLGFQFIPLRHLIAFSYSAYS